MILVTSITAHRLITFIIIPYIYDIIESVGNSSELSKKEMTAHFGKDEVQQNAIWPGYCHIFTDP